jgi:thiol-disulfide isomerase/thioredoxin
MYTLLTISDFTVVPLPNKSGQYLRFKSDRLTLVVFYAPSCQYSKQLLPHLEQLAVQFEGVVDFAILNVSIIQNSGIVDMARYTIQPIKYVPLMIVYKDYCPAITYDGPFEYEPIAQFLREAVNTLPGMTSGIEAEARATHAPLSAAPAPAVSAPPSGPSAVTTGVPIKGTWGGSKGNRYSSFTKAYT